MRTPVIVPLAGLLAIAVLVLVQAGAWPFWIATAATAIASLGVPVWERYGQRMRGVFSKKSS